MITWTGVCMQWMCTTVIVACIVKFTAGTSSKQHHAFISLIRFSLSHETCEKSPFQLLSASSYMMRYVPFCRKQHAYLPTSVALLRNSPLLQWVYIATACRCEVHAHADTRPAMHASASGIASAGLKSTILHYMLRASEIRSQRVWKYLFEKGEINVHVLKKIL